MTEFYITEQTKIEIGDVIWDRRKNGLVLMETENDIFHYSYLAPELYVIFRNKEINEGANWEIWCGWCGNHDQRIEDATCSHCGYVHKTVYGSLDALAKNCPSCHKKMSVKTI